MNYFFSVAILLCFALFYIKVFNRQFAETISLAACSVAMLLYAFTFVFPLNISAMVVSCLGLAGLAVAAIKELQSIRQTGWHPKKYVSYPFVFFILSCVVIFITKRGLLAQGWDEFSHWMLVSKNMYLFKNFGIGPYTTTGFTGYPPVTGLFNTFFTIFSPAFREDFIYMGMAVFILSLLFIPLKNAGRSFWNALLMFAVCALSPLMISSTVYHSIYVDSILGISFAALLYVYFSEAQPSVFKTLQLVLISSHLILTKASGAGLFAFAVVLFLLDSLFFKRNEFKAIPKKRQVTMLIGAACIVLIPLVVKETWSAYIHLHQIEGAWPTSRITLGGILELFTSARPDYRAVTLKNFISAFFELQDIFDAFLPFSYFTLPIALSLVWVYVWNISGQKKRSLYLGISLCAVLYFYALSLLVLYLFTYSEYEAQNLASLSRYMNTIVLGIVLFDVFIILDPSVLGPRGSVVSVQKKSLAQLASIITLVFVLCNTGSPIMNDLILFKPNKSEARALRSEYHISHKYLDQMDYKTDRVYYISQGGKGYDFQISKYNFTPVPVSGWALANHPAEGDLWTMPMTAEQWSQVLMSGNYTYVYIYHQDELFREEFGELFASAPQDKTFYKVGPAGNGTTVELTPVDFEISE